MSVFPDLPPANTHSHSCRHSDSSRETERQGHAGRFYPAVCSCNIFYSSRILAHVGAVIMCLLLLMAGNSQDGRRDRQCPKFRASSISAIPSAHGGSCQIPTGMPQSGAYARAQAVQWPGVCLKGKSRTSLYCTDLEFHPLSLLSAVGHLLLQGCSPDAPVR